SARGGERLPERTGERLAGPALLPAEAGRDGAPRVAPGVLVAEGPEIGTLRTREDLDAVGGAAAAGGMEEDVDRLALPGEYLTPCLNRRQGREGKLEADAGVGLIRHRGDQIVPAKPPAAEGLEPERARNNGLG